MRNKLALIIFIALLVPLLVSSVSTFVYREKDLVKIEPQVSDPDNDAITVDYEYPLNQSGEWQTDYGDAGKYKSKITVSDGKASDSSDIVIVVEKKEENPTIDFSKPGEENLQMDEGQIINFQIKATDLNKDELEYKWSVNDKKESEGEFFNFEPDYKSSGNYVIHVEVSDGTTTIRKYWNIEVRNVGLESMMANISDVVANENDIVSLNIPDFKKYGLEYSISEPIGNNNLWKTGYNDEGTYTVNVRAEGKGFKKDISVNIEIRNTDRTPVFEEIENKVIWETDELKIFLEASDPDNEPVSFSAEKMPPNSKLEGNVFTWKPGYDAVKKNTFVDKVLDKLGTLTKTYYLKFIASANGKDVVHNVIISVKDVNRAPVIQDIAEITVNEGETIKLDPYIFDPDNDKFTVSYSNFMASETYQTSFNDAGSHVTTVTAYDGSLSSSKNIQVNVLPTNRPPIFGTIADISANEGDDISIILSAREPDNDHIIFYLENAPENAKVEGNVFTWKPGYDLVNEGQKTLQLVLVASDGKSEAKQIVNANIMNKNREPIILNATGSQTARIGTPTKLFVDATDPDGDKLTYTWDFGILDKYEGDSSIQRIFTSLGIKEVTITVSDGKDSVEHKMAISVYDIRKKVTEGPFIVTIKTTTEETIID